jgi:hypothetical protein
LNIQFNTGYWIFFQGGSFFDSACTALPSERFDKITLSEFESLFSTKEIVGYLAPMDLYGGFILKGDLITRCPNKLMYQSVNSDHNKNYKDDVISVSHLLLPVELVETWEPIYKEEEKVVICGGRELKLKENNLIYIDGSVAFTFEGIAGLWKDIEPYIKSRLSPETTLSELKNLVDQFNPGK